MNTCPHNSIFGDNYGMSCADCGEKIAGFGYGGWFGRNLNGNESCIHQWLPVDDTEEVCTYCEGWRKKIVLVETE
jgi:hypothetical protein